jgi:hypothetical protein
MRPKERGIYAASTLDVLKARNQEERGRLQNGEAA